MCILVITNNGTKLRAGGRYGLKERTQIIMVFDFELDRSGLYYGPYTGVYNRSGYAYYGTEWDETKYKATLSGSFDNCTGRYYYDLHPGEHRDPAELMRRGICDSYEEMAA